MKRPSGWRAAGVLAALAVLTGAGWRWWQDDAAAAPETSATAPATAASALRAAASAPGPRAPYSDDGLRQRQAAQSLALQRLARAESTLAQYRQSTRYPPESRPLAEHPDQARPFEPISNDRPLRTPGNQPVAGVHLLTTQERVFVSGQESVRFTVAARDDQGAMLPLLITRSFAFDLPDPRQAVGRPAAAVPFNDSGQAGDAQAGDGIWSGVFQPATQGFADYAGTLRLQVDLNQNGRRGQLDFDIVYEPQVPARWTGGSRDLLNAGSLDFVLRLEVAQPGRYVVAGRVFDASGRPFALVNFNQELAAGPQEVSLPVFGKLVIDQRPSFPLTLRDVEGYLLFPDRFPDRAMLPRLAGVVRTSQRYTLAQFSDAEWQSEERSRYLDEFSRDVARAQADLPASAPPPTPRP
jgi:hypothetical protein